MRRTPGLVCLAGLLVAAGAHAGDVAPACAFGSDQFDGGLIGLVADASDPGEVAIEFRSGRGVLIRTIVFPDDIVTRAAGDMERLCHVGALALASRPLPTLTEALSSPSERVQASGAGGCDIAPDSPQQWESGDLCGGGTQTCFGACGAGCVGCQVSDSVDFCMNICQLTTLNCYTRPCCENHDNCLANATTLREQLECHDIAVDEGCGPADAAGQTYGEPDATCLDFTVCHEPDWWEDPILATPHSNLVSSQ